MYEVSEHGAGGWADDMGFSGAKPNPKSFAFAKEFYARAVKEFGKSTHGVHTKKFMEQMRANLSSTFNTECRQMTVFSEIVDIFNIRSEAFINPNPVDPANWVGSIDWDENPKEALEELVKNHVLWFYVNSSKKDWKDQSNWAKLVENLVNEVHRNVSFDFKGILNDQALFKRLFMTQSVANPRQSLVAAISKAFYLANEKPEKVSGFDRDTKAFKDAYGIFGLSESEYRAADKQTQQEMVASSLKELGIRNPNAEHGYYAMLSIYEFYFQVLRLSKTANYWK